MPAPPFKGRATRYERRQLLWLLAIRRLRTAERLSLAAIKTRLQKMSAPALEAFAMAHVAPGALADALSVPPTAAAATPSTAAKRPILPAAGLKGVGPSEQLLARWTRFDLALGLELNVREDASATVLELARRVRELCLANSG